jgi:hypothetical protein
MRLDERRYNLSTLKRCDNCEVMFISKSCNSLRAITFTRLGSKPAGKKSVFMKTCCNKIILL